MSSGVELLLSLSRPQNHVAYVPVIITTGTVDSNSTQAETGGLIATLLNSVNLNWNTFQLRLTDLRRVRVAIKPPVSA